MKLREVILDQLINLTLTIKITKKLLSVDEGNWSED